MSGAGPGRPQDDLYAAYRMRRRNEPVEDEIDYGEVMERWRRSPLNQPITGHGTTIPDWATQYFEERREHQNDEKVTVLNVIEGNELIISYQVGNRPTSRMYVRRSWAKAHSARPGRTDGESRPMG